MTNGKDLPEGGDGTRTQAVDPQVLEKIEKVRDHIRDAFGKAAMAMMAMPRYRHQTLADLNHLVLDPLIRDRLAIAYAPKQEGKISDVAGSRSGPASLKRSMRRFASKSKPVPFRYG